VQAGARVRHRSKPEWGVGLVLDDAAQGKCRIQFEHRGVVMLSLEVVGNNLEVLSPDEVAAHEAATMQRQPHQKRVKTGASRCAHCRQQLNKSLYSADRAWKSCPLCSKVNGVEHVFYEYPNAFGTSDARISDEAPDGAQSYCITCRPRIRQEPTARSRACSVVISP